jgi:uncharacterized peroxidase-related enzyme
MPHLPLPENLAGIVSLFAFRPETAQALNGIAEILLKGDESLSAWERELIATYVSHLNACKFCTRSHAAMVIALRNGDEALVEAVKQDYTTAPIRKKLKALLAIAARVQGDARRVSEADVTRAREAGASDRDIHDTVLIAAAFCMFNKYVDGLGTTEWAGGPEQYLERARLTVAGGYFHEKYD